MCFCGLLCTYLVVRGGGVTGKKRNGEREQGDEEEAVDWGKGWSCDVDVGGSGVCLLVWPYFFAYTYVDMYIHKRQRYYIS